MRNIKFRGQGINTKEWAYGHLFYGKNENEQEEAYIVPEQYECKCGIIDLTDDDILEVKTITVGQFTGLKDKNGKEIYEGDIVKINQKDIAWIEYNEKYASFVTNSTKIAYVYEPLCDFEDIEVISNIYDNPELIEGE